MSAALVPAYAQGLIALLPSWPWMLFWALVWLLVTGVMAVISGWWSLGKAFAAPAEVDGERFSFAFAVVGSEMMSVGHRARVTVNDAGFRVSVAFLSRLSSPPWFMPWREVVAVDETPGLFLTKATIRLRGLPLTIRFRGQLAHYALDTWARVRHAAN